VEEVPPIKAHQEVVVPAAEEMEIVLMMELLQITVLPILAAAQAELMQQEVQVLLF
jgi:hypothetical protein